MSGRASSVSHPAACGFHHATWQNRIGGASKHVRSMRSRLAASREVSLTAWHPIPTRNPGAFRMYAGASDDGVGSIDDSVDEDGVRDYLAELTWLPPLDPTKETEEIDATTDPTTMVLPVFPLGSTAYMPHSDHVLNIFEPRYRQMYSDILFNGSRRFVVPVSHPETGKLAAVAPVFYLEDLKEVSEQTADAVKYVCSHKVIGRVSIKRTLNDSVWADRSTYLKAVIEPLAPCSPSGPPRTCRTATTCSTFLNQGTDKCTQTFFSTGADGSSCRCRIPKPENSRRSRRCFI